MKNIAKIDRFEIVKSKNVRKYQRGNQKWTIQINWQHRVHETKTNKIKIQHNMCWTPLKTNRTSFLYGNRNGHHNTELRT